MSFYQTSKHLLQRINRGVAFVGMLFLVPMMLLTSSEVVSRALWNRPVPGSMELSSYMLALFILLGIAYTHQVKGHVKVTMFTTHLPEKAAVVLEMVTTLLSLFIVVLLAWQGWVEGLQEEAVSDMLRIPQMPFRLLVCPAGALLAMELIFDLVDSFGKLARRS